MKKKQKVDMAIALCLILIGIILLIIPLFKINNIKYLNTFIFALYTILNALQFLFTKESKDYESLHSAIASLIILIANMFIDTNNNPQKLAMLLMTWIILMSLAKLKKMDYYHDRKDRMWKLRAFNLGLFILSVFLASIHLSYSVEVKTIVIGFFMLIHGILELFDPITKILLTHD